MGEREAFAQRRRLVVREGGVVLKGFKAGRERRGNSGAWSRRGLKNGGQRVLVIGCRWGRTETRGRSRVKRSGGGRGSGRGRGRGRGRRGQGLVVLGGEVQRGGRRRGVGCVDVLLDGLAGDVETLLHGVGERG